MRDAVGVGDGVLHRQHAAPRVTEQRNGVQPEVASERVEVGDLGLDADILRLHARGRPATAALVVTDEPTPRGQDIEFGQQVGVVEIRPAVQHEQVRSGADLAHVQFRAVDRHVLLARFCCHRPAPPSCVG